LSCIRRGDIYSEFPTRTKVLAFWEEISRRWSANISDY
jgi:hypothetical protein